MKINFVVLCFLIANTVLGWNKANRSCECGVAGANNLRIVGGSRVQPHKYPWLVALMSGLKISCGGAIITDLHVLTAGHCVNGNHYKDFIVNVGMHDRLDNTFQQLRITKRVKHPTYKSYNTRSVNDIAVVTLSQRLVFSDRVRPICLPTPDLNFDDTTLTVAGWGLMKPEAWTSSRYLMEAQVQVVTEEDCLRIYHEKFVSAAMMCAYALGRDACQGDSGGPLFSTNAVTHNRKWYHVGIVSWGISCADADYPGVYTIVSKYIDWIKRKTRDGMYCS